MTSFPRSLWDFDPRVILPAGHLAGGTPFISSIFPFCGYFFNGFGGKAVKGLRLDTLEHPGQLLVGRVFESPVSGVMHERGGGGV